MATVLKTVGTMRLGATYSTDIRVYHLLLGNSKGLDKVHEVVECFLDVEGASLEQESHAVRL